MNDADEQDVELTQIVQLANQVASQDAPIDIIRVARLRRAVIEGDYRIDLYRIAAAIIDPAIKSD